MRNEKPKPSRRRIWLRRILLILAGSTFILAGVSCWLLVSLRVPTTSMEPYVLGGDHVVVFKPYYRWWNPERFSLVVLRNPEQGDRDERDVDYFLKRVAGLQGEKVQIKGGDLYVWPDGRSKPQIVVKDYSLFSELMVPVFDGPLDDLARSPFELHAERAHLHAGHLELTASDNPRESLACFYRTRVAVGGTGVSEILDGRNRDEMGEQVGDLLLRVVLEVEEEGAGFCAELGEAGCVFTFRIGGPDRKLLIENENEDGDLAFAEADYAGLPVDRPVTIEIWNVDDRLGIAIDGRVKMVETWPGGAKSVWSAPAFGMFKGKARVESVEILRDVHYTGGPQTWEVGVDEVFVLGDNSAVSRDSRMFGVVKISNLVGLPVAIVYPFARARFLD